MAENPEGPPRQFTDPKTGLLTESAYRWLEGFRVTGSTQIGAVLSGFTQIQTTLSTQIANETVARIAGDVAVAGAGDGTGVSDSRVFSAGVTSGATWVVLATCSVTPTGAGDYTFSFTGDAPTGHLDNEHPTFLRTFNGNWRIREEENGGGTPVTLASGTFTITHQPETVETGEGISITIPEFWETTFLSLPASPVTNTYSAMQVDLRFEIQRASGTNEIIAAGLSGSFGVAWS